jgi:hypothetical protein
VTPSKPKPFEDLTERQQRACWAFANKYGVSRFEVVDHLDSFFGNGDNPLLRIALCGYEGEHQMPGSWDCFAWKAHGGYSVQGHGTNRNRLLERVWFSPHCLKPGDRFETISLFDEAAPRPVPGLMEGE